MRNNTMNHVSDQASTVKFEPRGSDWPSTVTDVQTALEKIGSWANKDNGLPIATTKISGIIKLCTIGEVEAGVVDDKAVSPKVLKEFQTKPHATKDEYGTTRYASSDEMMALSSPDVSLNASGLSFVFENRGATESRSGALRVATNEQARQGTQDDRIMTPLKVKAAIDALVPKTGSATESSEGVVKLATVAEIQAGVARNGVSISPYGFANARGTTSAYGTFKAATDTQMTSFTGDDAAVTPAALGRNKGNLTKHGVVKLSTTKVNEANVAIAATADLLYLTGGIMTGRIYQGTQKESNKLITKSEATDLIQIGSMMMWPTDAEPDLPWTIADGKLLNKNEHAELFEKFGYMYGGSGDMFRIPDMRSMFPRGTDRGRGLDENRTTGSVQQCAVQYHKHITVFGESSTGPFGQTSKRGYHGSGKSDHDNYWYFSNDGSSWDGSNPNQPDVMASETRPINIAVNFIIKIS